MSIIQCKDVWEMHRIKFVIDGKPSWENFWALKGVSFSMEQGEALGIIGENGAGKTTILKLLAGILKPDRGTLSVDGRASGLLELGAGFQPELTGRENIYFNAGLYGLTPEEINARYEEIAAFADLGKFMHAPIKCYSAGMFVRLAFAVAVHIDPDIFLIDDTLAVGDENFQRKCLKKIFEIREQGKTVVLVTHDMHMLSRLCKRALFLKEGRVIRDDAVDKVIPLYTQTVGSRQGVGILEQKPLCLVFNNGRLFLNWGDKLLTPAPGAHACLCIADKWYNSFQASWEVTQEGPNTIRAVGTFYQLALKQIWRLELNDRHELSCDIELELQEPLEVREGYTSIVLTNEYMRWLTAFESGEFPPIDDKSTEWQSFLSDKSPARCIGLPEAEVPGGKIPSLVFTRYGDLPAARNQVCNTDYLTGARAVQFRTPALRGHPAAQGSRLSLFSGKIALGVPRVEEYLKTVENEAALYTDKTKLTFSRGRGILSYGGSAVTKAEHIYTSLYAGGRWYSSQVAHWQILKQGKDTIVLSGSWPGLPLRQVWEVEVSGKNAFLWKVSVILTEALDVEQQYFILMGRPAYTHWFSKYGTGRFPEHFLETEADMIARCISSGEVGFSSAEQEGASVSLRFSPAPYTFSKILNANAYHAARIVRIEKIEPEDRTRFEPGEYGCFALKLALAEGARTKPDDYNLLPGRKLKFAFDSGSGRIFWEGKELTKKLGLYTSLRSGGRWHDSMSHAVWTIENKSGSAIRASGQWLHLPIRQAWTITLLENDSIELSFAMTVDREIEIDRLQTNLMVSELYSQWMEGAQKHRFPGFSDDADDDWDVVYSQDNGAFIGVAEEHTHTGILPAVTLLAARPQEGCLLNIVNSDTYHRGRVLQCLDARSKLLPAGDYQYFNGRLFIGGPPASLHV